MDDSRAIVFMERAIEIAQGVDPHLVAPNPRVGCVIVSDGAIVAEGVHEYFGGPHAEVNAIDALLKLNLERTQLDQLEVYVSLEPCDHFVGKKTGSCADRLLELKPKKVIVGALDPKFGGRSLLRLEKEGIETLHSSYSTLHNQLNPFFNHYQIHGRPWMTMKIGQSLNGRITGGNPYITNSKSLKRVHQMRAQFSAILTTTETVLQDDPQFDTRLEDSDFPVSNAKLIILGKRKIPRSYKIWEISDREMYFFETLEALLESDLYASCDSVMTECGSEMNSLLLENELVDEIEFHIAPKILGPGEKGSFDSEIMLEGFGLMEEKDFGGDLCLRYRKSL